MFLTKEVFKGKGKQQHSVCFSTSPHPGPNLNPLPQLTKPSSTTPAWDDARPWLNEGLLSLFDVEHHGCSVPHIATHKPETRFM